MCSIADIRRLPADTHSKSYQQGSTPRAQSLKNSGIVLAYITTRGPNHNWLVLAFTTVEKPTGMYSDGEQKGTRAKSSSPQAEENVPPEPPRTCPISKGAQCIPSRTESLLRQ